MSRIQINQSSDAPSRSTQTNQFGNRADYPTTCTEDRYERRYLLPEDVSRLFQALKARDRQLHDMSYIALLAGLRASEICNLKGGDIDPKNNVLYVPGRKRRPSPIATNQALMEILERYKKSDGDYLFTSSKGEKINHISGTFTRTAEDIGISPPTARVIDGKRKKIQRTKEEVEVYSRNKICFGTLRHTFAVWLSVNGHVTLYELHDALRNNNFEITKRYARYVTKQYDEKEASRRATAYIRSCLDGGLSNQ